MSSDDAAAGARQELESGEPQRRDPCLKVSNNETQRVRYHVLS